MIKNKNVVIIGGDHHNTLSVVRCLGKNGCNIKLIIHDDENLENKIKIFKSKFVKDKYLINNNAKALISLLRSLNLEKNTIIFPCSDLAAYTLDYYANILNDKFLIPGFKNKPGLVCKMMDKFEQKLWANRNRILMAKTECIDLNNFIEDSFLLQQKFPIILKPIVSAFGSKGDIEIVRKKEDLNIAIENFKNKNYKKILVQEFLKKKFEICAFGCMLENENEIYYGVLKKVREFPVGGGGSLTFAKFICEEKILNCVNNVLKKMHSEGYRGNFDVEFLVCEDDIYLNEINFRHSGNGVALIKFGIPAPYIFCKGQWKESISDYKIKIADNLVYMDELNDIKQLKHHNLDFFQFINNLKDTGAFSVFDKDDLSGTWGFYKPKIIAQINKIKVWEKA